jgi:hypothetical protein
MQPTPTRKKRALNASFALLFLLLGVAGHGGMAQAQSPSTFTATGTMTGRRLLHTATLLTDGRVLITGGDNFQTLSTAELYDPRTGTFTATGNMTTPRSGHSATLLPNGRVLIAGGGRTNDGKREALTSAELYDPGTGAFSATGEMTMPRYAPTATLLYSGKVLIAGGLYPCAGQVGSTVFVSGASCFPFGAELYDPDTGTFAATGNMIAAWADTATLLTNGKLLITSGNPQVGPYLSSAQLYEPSIGTFAFAGYAQTNHTGPTATLLMNGKVLLAGGDIGDGDGASFVAEQYDLATGAFSRTGSMTVGRGQHTATLLPDGGVLFAGGHNNDATSAELYDPLKGAFSRTGSMPIPRELHTATLLNDGRVLIAGGDDQRYWIPETILSSALLYTPAVLIPAPVLLSLSGDGKGQGAILYANTARVVTASDQAIPGDVLEIYCTGLKDDSVIPPQVTIGGRLAEVLYFGKAPGFPNLNQVNVRMPFGVVPGYAVPVRLSSLGRFSNEVTIGVNLDPG